MKCTQCKVCSVQCLRCVVYSVRCVVNSAKCVVWSDHTLHSTMECPYIRSSLLEYIKKVNIKNIEKKISCPEYVFQIFLIREST